MPNSRGSPQTSIHNGKSSALFSRVPLYAYLACLACEVVISAAMAIQMYAIVYDCDCKDSLFGRKSKEYILQIHLMKSGRHPQLSRYNAIQNNQHVKERFVREGNFGRVSKDFKVFRDFRDYKD